MWECMCISNQKLAVVVLEEALEPFSNTQQARIHTLLLYNYHWYVPDTTEH